MNQSWFKLNSDGLDKHLIVGYPNLELDTQFWYLYPTVELDVALLDTVSRIVSI